MRLASLLVAMALAPSLSADAATPPRESCAASSDAPAASAAFPLRAVPGRRVALALGSGSMHGYAHVGVIQELEARGVEVNVVTGSSVGALVGALWASGLSGREVESVMMNDAWESSRRPALSLQGVFSNEPLRADLDRIFNGRPVEQWPRRFGAVATRLADGGRRLLSRGDGALAVQASTAVPVLYKPVTVAGESLVDGALVEPVPVEAARELGADVVIAVDVAYRPYEEEAHGMPLVAFQAMHILVNRLGTQQMRDADVAIRLEVHRVYMDCGRAATIAAGRDAVRRAWPDLARVLSKPPERRAAR